jgi:hypothetical protein
MTTLHSSLVVKTLGMMPAADMSKIEAGVRLVLEL